MIHRQGADESVAGNQRADQRRCQRRRQAGSRGFQFRARASVDQRAPVLRHPAGQPLAALQGQLLNQLGVDAGGKPAVQRLVVLGVEKQRAARERHQAAQLRRDVRHRVAAPRGSSPSSGRSRRARRSRDARRRCRRIPTNVGGTSAPEAAGIEAPAPRHCQRKPRKRQVRALGFRADVGQDPQERRHGVGVERLAGLLLDLRGRRFDGHRLVIGPVRGERVEVVDQADDARAERNVLPLQP